MEPPIAVVPENEFNKPARRISSLSATLNRARTRPPAPGSLYKVYQRTGCARVVFALGQISALRRFAYPIVKKTAEPQIAGSNDSHAQPRLSVILVNIDGAPDGKVVRMPGLCRWIFCSLLQNSTAAYILGYEFPDFAGPTTTQ